MSEGFHPEYDFWNHPKPQQLRDILNNPIAPYMLMRLVVYADHYFHNGVLVGMSKESIFWASDGRTLEDFDQTDMNGEVISSRISPDGWIKALEEALIGHRDGELAAFVLDWRGE